MKLISGVIEYHMNKRYTIVTENGKLYHSGKPNPISYDRLPDIDLVAIDHPNYGRSFMWVSDHPDVFDKVTGFSPSDKIVTVEDMLKNNPHVKILGII